MSLTQPFQVQEPGDVELQQRGHGNGGLLLRLSCSCGGDHEEGACRNVVAAGKGSGKGKQGKGKAESLPMSSSVTFVCKDFIDVIWVKRLGAMPLAVYVDCTPGNADRDELWQPAPPSGTLRQVCCQMLESNEMNDGSGIEAWYKEDKLPLAVGLRGRRWAGIQKRLMTESEAGRLGHRFSSGYHATRSVFTYRKEVRQLLRGGHENNDRIRDYDIS